MPADAIAVTWLEVHQQQHLLDLELRLARQFRRMRRQFRSVLEEINKGYGENFFDGL